MRQTLSAFWGGRSARERTFLAAASSVIVLGLLYTLLIDPALTGRRQLEKKLPVLRQQSAELQALSKQVNAFSGKSAPSSSLSRESLEAGLARKGLKPQSVVLTGDFVKLQFTSVSFAATLDWLNEMQKTARLVVVEAKIDALAQADMVNATLTLRQAKE